MHTHAQRIDLCIGGTHARQTTTARTQTIKPSVKEEQEEEEEEGEDRLAGNQQELRVAATGSAGSRVSGAGGC